jgi:septal ring factor EnvC (AmiA/AmiB activator)
MKALLTGIAVFCGGLWAVLNFTIGLLKEDASALRLALDKNTEAIRTIDSDSLRRTNDVSAKLSEQLSNLGINVVKLEGTVTRLDGNVNRLDANLNRMDANFIQITGRLDQFGKSLDSLSSRMDKLQIALTPSPEADARRANQLAEYLKRSGLDKDRIIIVPAGVFPN